MELCYAGLYGSYKGVGKVNIIHKSLIGSRAHGLHNDDSDYDYRYIYVAPTKDILSLGYKEKTTNTITDNKDDVYYEIGHFLRLATKANPTVLELITKDNNLITTKYSKELIELLPYLYNPKDAFNAFTGYSHNQQKMFNKCNDRVKYKFATAKVRTLYNLCDLLRDGYFSLSHCNEQLDALKKIKNGEFSDGEITSLFESLKITAKFLLNGAENKQDLNLVNEFLFKIRKDFL